MTTNRKVRAAQAARTDPYRRRWQPPGNGCAAGHRTACPRAHRTDLDAPGRRNHTISRAGDGPARITAQYREDGVVSPWLSGLCEGEHVLITGPFGDAVVDPAEDRPLLVLTAGLGITSALAMAHALVAARSERPVDCGHVVRDTESLPRGDELRQAAARLRRARLHLHVTRAKPQTATVQYRAGRPDTAVLGGILTDPLSTEAHLCGLTAFVTAMRTALQAAGVPAHSIRYDAFYAPRTVDITPRPAPHPGPLQVTYRPSETTAKWTPESGTLLDLADAQGLTLPASCRAGACGTYVATVHGPVAQLLDPAPLPLKKDDIVAGRPAAATRTPEAFDDTQIGLWSLTVGTVRDVEIDEIRKLFIAAG